jgi:hypothetical protein
MVHLLFWGISSVVFGLILYSKSLNIKDKYKKYLEGVYKRYDELEEAGKDTSMMEHYTYEGWKDANCIASEYFGVVIRFFFICGGIYLILLGSLAIFDNIHQYGEIYIWEWF